MTYYKVLNENGFVGIGTTDDLRKYQEKHNIMLVCNENEAEFIQVDDELYRDIWMIPSENKDYKFEEATVIAIDEGEYNTLISSVGNKKKIEEILRKKEIEESVPVEETFTAEETVTADFVRDVKIREMSLACNKAIMNGFDVELSDGIMHHFSLTLQDQANLATAQMHILAGDNGVDYHADGEEYKVFSADDMVIVIDAANKHRMYHLAYYNSMKTWLNSLVRIKNIQDVKYGDEIPKRYQSAMFKRVME